MIAILCAAIGDMWQLGFAWLTTLVFVGYICVFPTGAFVALPMYACARIIRNSRLREEKDG